MTRIPSHSHRSRRRGTAARGLTFAIAGVLSSASGPYAWATGNNWTGATSAVWENGANWSGGVPSSTHDVVFPATIPASGPTITLSSADFAQSLIFNNDFTLSGT